MKPPYAIAFQAAIGLFTASLLPGLPHTAGAQDSAATAPPKPMPACMEMAGMQKKMRTRMAAMDTDLDRLVVAMNRARGARKTDAIAALLTKMVAQRKAQREQMAGMEMGRMGHMMRHSEAGDGSATRCPMMQDAMRSQKPR